MKIFKGNRIKLAIQIFINEVKKEKCPELLDVISLRKIENNFNINLRAVHIKPLKNKLGKFDEFSHSININSKSILNLSNKKSLLLLIHEMIHSLSYDSYYGRLGFRKDRLKGAGIGITEGITELLAEKILGIENHTYFYPIETSTCGILCSLIGSRPFIKDLIYGEKKVEKEFENQYGYKMLMLYKSVSSLLDTITISERDFLSADINSDLYHSALFDYNKAKFSLDKVLDEMVSIALEKNTNLVELSNLLHEVAEYPENENFKLFNFKKNMIIENYDNEVNHFLESVMYETNEVTITQINTQSKNIRKSILQNVKSFISKKFDKYKGEEK